MMARPLMVMPAFTASSRACTPYSGSLVLLLLTI